MVNSQVNSSMKIVSTSPKDYHYALNESLAKSDAFDSAILLLLCNPNRFRDMRVNHWMTRVSKLDSNFVIVAGPLCHSAILLTNNNTMEFTFQIEFPQLGPDKCT